MTPLVCTLAISADFSPSDSTSIAFLKVSKRHKNACVVFHHLLFSDTSTSNASLKRLTSVYIALVNLGCHSCHNVTKRHLSRFQRLYNPQIKNEKIYNHQNDSLFFSRQSKDILARNDGSAELVNFRLSCFCACHVLN